MRKFGVLVGGLLVMSLAFSTMLQAAEGDAKGGAKKQRPAKKKTEGKAKKVVRLGGEYDAMIKEANLEEAQIAQLREKVAAQKAADKAWQEDPAKGGKLKELQKAIKEAGADKEKAKGLREEMKSLQKDVQDAKAAGLKEIEGILKPEQKAAWEGYKLCKQLEGPLRKAELTDDQKAKLRELCDKAAKDMPEDKKARAGFLKDLKEKALALLTPEQTQKLQAKPVKKEQPEKKEKPAKPRKGNDKK